MSRDDGLLTGADIDTFELSDPSTITTEIRARAMRPTRRPTNEETTHE